MTLISSREVTIVMGASKVSPGITVSLTHVLFILMQSNLAVLIRNRERGNVLVKVTVRPVIPKGMNDASWLEILPLH